MLIGYLAVNQHGDTLHLIGDKYPRKQLLEKTGSKHVSKMYCDRKDGKSTQVGYVIGLDWWNIYEVHSWNNHKEEK